MERISGGLENNVMGQLIFIPHTSNTGTGDKNFTFSQGVPTSTWIVPHNLGKLPSVTIIDSAGDQVEGSIHFDSINQVTITFSAAFSGVATCN